MKTVIVPFCGYLKVGVYGSPGDNEAIERALNMRVSAQIATEENNLIVVLGEFKTFRRLIENGDSALSYADAVIVEGE
jgi:hypothetical protein